MVQTPEPNTDVESSDDGGFALKGGQGHEYGSVDDYQKWDWVRIEAAILGGYLVQDRASARDQAASIADPQSLYHAAKVLRYVERVLAMVAKSVADQAQAIAGEHGPWQGEAAKAFLKRMQDWSKTVATYAKQLGGGDIGVNGIPGQFVEKGYDLAVAQAKIRAIDQWFGQQALMAGVPRSDNGYIRVYGDNVPLIYKAMNKAMRGVLVWLAERYTHLTVPPYIPPGSGGPGGGPGTENGLGDDETLHAIERDLNDMFNQANKNIEGLGDDLNDMFNQANSHFKGLGDDLNDLFNSGNHDLEGLGDGLNDLLNQANRNVEGLGAGLGNTLANFNGDLPNLPNAPGLGDGPDPTRRLAEAVGSSRLPVPAPAESPDPMGYPELAAFPGTGGVRGAPDDQKARPAADLPRLTDTGLDAAGPGLEPAPDLPALSTGAPHGVAEDVLPPDWLAGTDPSVLAGSPGGAGAPMMPFMPGGAGTGQTAGGERSDASGLLGGEAVSWTDPAGSTADGVPGSLSGASAGGADFSGTTLAGADPAASQGAGAPMMPFMPGGGGAGTGDQRAGERPDASGLLGGETVPWLDGGSVPTGEPDAQSGAVSGGAGLVNPTGQPGVLAPMMPLLPGGAGTGQGRPPTGSERSDSSGLLGGETVTWMDDPPAAAGDPDTGGTAPGGARLTSPAVIRPAAEAPAEEAEAAERYAVDDALAQHCVAVVKPAERPDDVTAWDVGAVGMLPLLWQRAARGEGRPADKPAYVLSDGTPWYGEDAAVPVQSTWRPAVPSASDDVVAGWPDELLCTAGPSDRTAPAEAVVPEPVAPGERSQTPRRAADLLRQETSLWGDGPNRPAVIE